MSYPRFFVPTMENLIDKVKKSDSFQVPDGYFSELPDKVMEKIAAEEKVAQLLEKHREGHSFPVPDGYFENLPNQVMERIGETEKHRTLFLRRVITSISVAASLILVVGIGLLWNTFQNKESANTMTATVVEKPSPTPATAELTLPENTLANVVVPDQTASVPSSSKRTSTQSQNELLEKKADDFVEKYAYENMDDIDYDILDYFSEEDYITVLLES